MRAVISLMSSRHNLDEYEAAGLVAIHLPVEQNEAGLIEAVDVIRRETRKRGAVAIHDNRYTDFVASICAHHLLEHRGIPIEESLESAAEAGLKV